MINKGVLRQFLAATAGKKNRIASSEIIKRLYNYTFMPTVALSATDHYYLSGCNFWAH